MSGGTRTYRAEAATAAPVPQRPVLNPWSMAALDVLAEHVAARHGDTATVTAQRQADLIDDLKRNQAKRGATYRHARQTATGTATTKENDQ